MVHYQPTVNFPSTVGGALAEGWRVPAKNPTSRKEREKWGTRRLLFTTDPYRLACAACIPAIRSCICRVRCGVMPSMRSITINCPR